MKEISAKEKRIRVFEEQSENDKLYLDALRREVEDALRVIPAGR